MGFPLYLPSFATLEFTGDILRVTYSTATGLLLGTVTMEINIVQSMYIVYIDMQ